MANNMNKSLWGTLPEECLDHIVAFLPLPALSRFRVVSKKYSAWILSKEFIKLCAQLPLRGSQVWMACREKMGGFVSTNFKVCAGAKLLGSAHEGIMPYFGPQWERHMRAALGCLLFVECTKFPTDGSSPIHFEMICDFLTMTCSRLPQPIVRPTRWYGYSHVMFGQCGEDAGAFKIATMDLTDDEDQQDGYPYSFQLYDSVTQSWRKLHPEATSRFTYGEMINCTFIFDKIFCLLRMGPMQSKDRHEIVVFDTSTEKYECGMMITIVGKKKAKKKKQKRMPGFILGEIYGEITSGKLVAANGRLHLTGWFGDEVFQVYEVDLPNEQLTKIAYLPRSLMQDVRSDDVQIEGHRDCILLSSSKGGNVLYDLCKKSWRVLRDCPLFGGEILSNFRFSMENGNGGDVEL